MNRRGIRANERAAGTGASGWDRPRRNDTESFPWYIYKYGETLPRYGGDNLFDDVGSTPAVV